MNFIGAPVAATADKAPPPLADPSNFVTRIEPMGVASLKALLEPLLVDRLFRQLLA